MKTQIKAVLAISLVLAVVLSFAGCGNNNSGNTGSSNTSTPAANSTAAQVSSEPPLVYQSATDEIKNASVDSEKLQINGVVIKLPISLGDLQTSCNIKPDSLNEIGGGMYGITELDAGKTYLAYTDTDTKNMLSWEFKNNSGKIQSIEITQFKNTDQNNSSPTEKCILSGICINPMNGSSPECFDIILPGGISMYKEYSASELQSIYGDKLIMTGKEYSIKNDTMTINFYTRTDGKYIACDYWLTIK